MKNFLTFMMIFALSGIGAYAQKPMPGNGEWEKWRMTPAGKCVYYNAEITYRSLEFIKWETYTWRGGENDILGKSYIRRGWKHLSKKPFWRYGGIYLFLYMDEG